MFSFLKRPAHPLRTERHDASPPCHDDSPRLGWLDLAGELRSGAEVTEIEGDFAASVFLEHFAAAEKQA